MATDISVTKTQTTSVVVFTGNEETCQNLLSIIQRSGHGTELADIRTHVITTTMDDQKKASYKRRQADMTCVICEDKCCGYNFNVISCGSCKSFFHRNASQNVNDLRCLTNTSKCDVRFKNRRRICRRCRLEKCLSAGMKWNSSMDEKLHKQRQLEENRRLTKNSFTTIAQTSLIDVSLEENTCLMNESITASESHKDSTIEQLQATRSPSVQETTLPFQNFFCTTSDHNRLNSVKLSYETAFRVTASKCDISAMHHINDRRSALLYLTSGVHNASMKLITFIRSIPEFKLLDEQDRLVLVKHNFPLTFSMCACLNYDANRDLIINSEAETEEHAVAYRQLACYCYGKQFDLEFNQLCRSIKTISDDDPIILQLMMVIFTFTKVMSVEDIVVHEQPTLVNDKQVYEAQSVYISLLFRYMIKKYAAYYQAARQYSRLIQQTIQMQMLLRTYQQILQEQLDETSDEEINPILKSILHLH